MEARKQYMKPTYLSFLTFFVALMPSMSVGYKTKTIEGCIVQLKLHNGLGPESIAFYGFGHGPYTGVSNGRILKWRGIEPGWKEFAYNSMPWYVILVRRKYIMLLVVGWKA